MKKSIYLMLLGGVVLVIILYLLRSELFRIFPSTDLVNLSKRELRNASIQALKKGDDPISAIVLYNYTLIGRGYNTIHSDTNIVGHAVINALDNAIKSMGWDQFNGLDKKSIIIMTTTEPCQLCKAVLQEYGILRVEFMKKRSVDYWLDSYWIDIASEFNKRQLNPYDLQDSLYQLKSNY